MVDISMFNILEPGVFTAWHEKELYFGREGDPYQLPNVHDIVYTLDHGMKRIIDVDVTTLSFSWEDYNPYGVLVTDPRTEQSDPDLVSIRLLGSGHGVPADHARAYLDTTVWPYTISMPATIYCNNPAVKYYRLFEGTSYDLLSENVISAYYDAGGNYLTDTIPMLKNDFDATREAYTYCAVGSCIKKLKDHTPITAVFYSRDSRVIEVRQLLVKNTDLIPRHENTTDPIVDIRLVGRALREGDDTIIELPQGLTIPSLGLQCRVTYRSGKEVYMPLDGEKVALNGIDAFASRVPGSRHHVTLSFSLDELDINQTELTVSTSGRLTKSYVVTITSSDDTLSTKLFVVPNWLTETTGYELKTYLFNMGRTMSSQVTDYVEVLNFDPLLYGEEQEVHLQLNLSDVSLSLPNSPQTYVIYITLRDPLTLEDGTPPWTLRYELGQEPPLEIPLPVTASNNGDGNWTYDLSLGHTGYSAWVNAMYWTALPMYDVDRESSAPAPNRFRILIGDSVVDRPIEDFDVPFITPTTLPAHASISLEFYRLTGTSEAITAMIGVKTKRI